MELVKLGNECLQPYGHSTPPRVYCWDVIFSASFLKKPGWEYLKTWVGTFQVGIYGWEFSGGDFDWREFFRWEFSGWEFS